MVTTLDMKRNDDVEQLCHMCETIATNLFSPPYQLDSLINYWNLLTPPGKLGHSPGNFAKNMFNDFAYQSYFKRCRFLLYPPGQTEDLHLSEETLTMVFPATVMHFKYVNVYKASPDSFHKTEDTVVCTYVLKLTHSSKFQ